MGAEVIACDTRIDEVVGKPAGYRASCACGWRRQSNSRGIGADRAYSIVLELTVIHRASELRGED